MPRTNLSRHIGRRIRGLRRSKGLTQEAAGARAGIDRRVLAKWEVGDNTPPIDRLLTIAVIFDVPLDYFVDGYAGLGRAA